MPCTINQEPDPETSRYRWLIQAVDPCKCTEIGMGGFSTFVPYRPYEVTYYDTFMISSDAEEIKQWLNCPACSVEGPLGMEDKRIPDDRITASSVYDGRQTTHGPARARLNTERYAAAWCHANLDNVSPWIQVDFNGTVTITGLITQGRGDLDQWVTEYQVTYSNDAQSWYHVTDADGTPIKFPGNTDRNTLVTTRLPFALHTRILRIHPTDWNEHCSMRFEVIGCYYSDKSGRHSLIKVSKCARNLQLNIIKRNGMNFPICQLWHIASAVWYFALFAICVIQSEAASNLPTVTSLEFTAASQFNSPVKYRVIRSSQRGSRLRCAAACLKQVNCSYFSYTTDSRQCELCDDSIVATNEENLKYYRRSVDVSCSVEAPLGMEDGRILNESITASSFYSADHAPSRARLNIQGYAGAWSSDTADVTSPWIQVDFNRPVTITSLITQGRGDPGFTQWVTEYQVTYSDDALSWDHVADADGTPIKFHGNKDKSIPVTNRLPVALRTRILRIHPTAWFRHCSMRFEVIGCYDRRSLPCSTVRKFVSVYTTMLLCRKDAMNLSICQLWHDYVIWCFALLAVFVVQGGAASNPPTVTSSRFTAESQFNSTVKYRVIRSSQRGSRLGCAAACLNEVNCSYFSYTKDTRRCELSDDSIVATNEEKLKYYRRSGDFSCSVEGPLGMEDGRIPDESITASSFWDNRADHAPPRARLNTKGYAGAWVEDSGDLSPWIQVDFNGIVTITGLITQGREDNDQWVTEYQVTYSNDAQSWHHVTDATPIKFPGNSDRNTLVAARFPFALRTRILRIHPTAWVLHRSMRFEVIGCY
ncbi:uncharacterized protein LOC119731795 [Patiria miniata]|uniref:Uncharacterized protein n=1 Tax=Patiria miniata TaxID=46514 RepID=A0A914ABZ9_PATMI|nr:uncharacterized protein LOC119731795 [Patiria miniata]